MPLHCFEDGARIEACGISDSGWANLRKRHAERKHLRFRCSSIAIPKVSHLGTRFFAHHDRSNSCGCSKESASHLFLKSLIANAANGLGWRVHTEHTFASGTQCDVFASHGDFSVIFEVQMSRQSNPETLRRQSLYLQEAQKCVWLFRQTKFESGADIPAFNIQLRLKERDAIVGIPPRWKSNQTWTAEVPLQTFVKAVLGGTLQWEAFGNGRAVVRLEGRAGQCPHCASIVPFLCAGAIKVGDMSEVTRWFWELPRTVLKTLESRAAEFGLPPLVARVGPYAGRFLSNSCEVCSKEIINDEVRLLCNHRPGGGQVGAFEVDLNSSLLQDLGISEREFGRWRITTEQPPSQTI